MAEESKEDLQDSNIDVKSIEWIEGAEPTEVRVWILELCQSFLNGVTELRTAMAEKDQEIADLITRIEALEGSKK